MGIRLPRKKPRKLIASIAYRLKPLIPTNVMLDLASITNRLAFEKAVEAGHELWAPIEFIQKHIPLESRVLELGCSSGRVLSQLKAAERVGVDHDKEAIERGRQAHRDIIFIHGDALAHTTDHFDVVILSHVLEHIDDPRDLLSRIKDQFDRIFLEVPDFDCTTLNHVRQQRGRDLIYTDADHVTEFSRDELEALFEEVGLAVIDSEFRWGVLRYWLAKAHPGNESERARRLASATV